jgi:molybdate transport system ATP-binding protein
VRAEHRQRRHEGRPGSGEFGAIVDVQLRVGPTPLAARVTRKAAAELGLAPGTKVFAMVKAVSIDRRSVGFA